MKVTSKATFYFKRVKRTERPANLDPGVFLPPYEVVETCHVLPTGAGRTQTVPDWVRDNNHFRQRVQDGLIAEVLEAKVRKPDVDAGVEAQRLQKQSGFNGVNANSFGLPGDGGATDQSVATNNADRKPGDSEAGEAGDDGSATNSGE